MKLEIPTDITREFIQSHRDLIFLYANDLQNMGTTGQAAIARGEPNAYCIPTRWKNCNTDARHILYHQGDKIYPIWNNILKHLRSLPQPKVVLPGLLDEDDMEFYAPALYDFLSDELKGL